MTKPAFLVKKPDTELIWIVMPAEVYGITSNEKYTAFKLRSEAEKYREAMDRRHEYLDYRVVPCHLFLS